MTAQDVKSASVDQSCDVQSMLIESLKRKISTLSTAGLKPRRAYMSYRTKVRLMGGVFHRPWLVTVPRGTERIDTVLGLEVCIAESLLDWFIDVGVDD